MDSRPNGVIGAAAAIIGITIVAVAQATSQTFHAGYGPGLFPTLIGSGMVICGGSCCWVRCCNTVGGTVREVATVDASSERGRSLVGLTAVFGSVLFYYIFVDILGFLIVATAVMAPLMWLQWKRPVASLLIAFLTAYLLMQIFAGGLRVPLPWGPLLPYSRVLLWM